MGYTGSRVYDTNFENLALVPVQEHTRIFIDHGQSI